MHKSWMWKQRSYREQAQGDEGGRGSGGVAEAQQQDESQEQEGEQTEGATPEEEAPAGEGDDQPDDVIVTIGDETPPASNDDEIEGKPAPAWVKELRKSDREKAKRIRELEQQVAASKQATQPQQVKVGEKPTLEGCDYDAEKYGEELVAWNERKRQVEAQAAKEQEAQEAAAAAWNAKLTAYKAASAALKVEDFDGAEHVIRETMSPVQQAVILNGADRPELVVYALGRSPAKAKELAAINDPVKFAFAVAKLETQLKVTPRKTAPLPEKTVRGSAPVSGTIDSTLERLRAEASKSGDYTKVSEYRRKQREKQ